MRKVTPLAREILSSTLGSVPTKDAFANGTLVLPEQIPRLFFHSHRTMQDMWNAIDQWNQRRFRPELQQAVRIFLYKRLRCPNPPSRQLYNCNHWHWQNGPFFVWQKCWTWLGHWRIRDHNILIVRSFSMVHMHLCIHSCGLLVNFRYQHLRLLRLLWPSAIWKKVTRYRGRFSHLVPSFSHQINKIPT